MTLYFICWCLSVRWIASSTIKNFIQMLFFVREMLEFSPICWNKIFRMKLSRIRKMFVYIKKPQLNIQIRVSSVSVSWLHSGKKLYIVTFKFAQIFFVLFCFKKCICIVDEKGRDFLLLNKQTQHRILNGRMSEKVSKLEIRSHSKKYTYWHFLGIQTVHFNASLINNTSKVWKLSF